MRYLRDAILVGITAGTLLPALASADGRSAEDLYPKSCAVCHAAGIANAPKTGDAEAWQTRKDAKEPAALIESIKNGLNAMPPKGMCMDCTDDEYQALIDFMATAE